MDNVLVASVADVVAFVRSGLTAPGLTVSVLAKKLYFIEHIAVTAVYGDGSAKAIPNDNWFWRASNNKNRFELAADIEKCVDFNDMDANYQKIITRYEKADAYGIVKPVKKVFFGSVDKKIFDMIVEIYQLDTTERECYKKTEHYFKLKYCYESNATFEEFVSWVVAEKILGLSLNLIQAGVVDGAVYGDINELVNVYMTDEYFDVVGEMKRLYSLHIGSRTNLSDRYVDQGLVCKAANNYVGFLVEQKKIEFLWEPPDGAFETERRYYESERKKYLERLGEFTYP
ncbi:MAG: hypothetical protein UGF89_12790 [Acutalibacteraceae bacterium]|nr:hypothetical protein [Acutalibacteraceae bacterium]